MQISYSSSSRVYTFDASGGQVFPCRCGQTHTGDYAAYDYAHHNCFHSAWMELDTDLPRVLICLDCGQTSALVEPDTQDTATVSAPH